MNLEGGGSSGGVYEDSFDLEDSIFLEILERILEFDSLDEEFLFVYFLLVYYMYVFDWFYFLVFLILFFCIDVLGFGVFIS